MNFHIKNSNLVFSYSIYSYKTPALAALVIPTGNYANFTDKPYFYDLTLNVYLRNKEKMVGKTFDQNSQPKNFVYLNFPYLSKFLLFQDKFHHHHCCI